MLLGNGRGNIPFLFFFDLGFDGSWIHRVSFMFHVLVLGYFNI